ncbi:MAG: tetratricopeptide repeat protein [Treponema sp.]|nr:tetratricopeptide repeat protein [Treponema sp.]
MMKFLRKKNSLKLFFFICVFTFFSGEQVFAKKKKTSASAVVTKESASPSETAVKIPVVNKSRTYFYKIDPAVMEGVEKGSPSSIQQAMKLLRKGEVEYTENERVLLYVCSQIIEIAYPSEKVTWQVFEYNQENAYVGALNSVKSGVFDTSTGNEDFLGIVLPAFVLFKANKSDVEIYTQCENALKEALKVRGDSVLVNYMLGILYENQGKFKEAEPYLEKAFSLDNKCQEVGIAYSKAISKNGNTDKAREIVKQVAGSENPNNLAVLKQNAYIAFDNSDYDAAEEYVARVLQQTPTDLEFVLFRAKIYIEKNDYIHAVSLLDMYARQSTTDIDYLVLRARVQLDWSKNTTAASETIEKALQYYPDNLEALMLAAKLSSQIDLPVAGKYADELAAMVLEKDPENAEALVYALDGLIKRESWQEAYKISRELVKKEKVLPEVIFRFVTVCLKTGKNGEALDTAVKAYNSNKTDEYLIQAYVLAYSSVGNRDTAMSIINSMLSTASPKIKSYLYYRRSYLQRGEENILADLRSSLIANSRNSEALFRLYEIYYAKKDYRKAQYYLRQVVAINPNDSSLKKLNDSLTQLIQ